MVKDNERIDSVIEKLSCKVMEYEMILADLKGNLQDKNIRRVYRQLNVAMPKDLEAELYRTGAILWEEFTKTAVNKFDIKGIMSQQLGNFDTGLCVLPPVDSLYRIKELEDLGGIFANQLDLTQLYVAIE